MEKVEKLSIKEKLGYALTAMGSDMTTQTTGSFLQLFFTSVVGIPIAQAALIISLSAIWDAINDPLIAHWVDNHKFKNGERMRPVLAFSVVPFAIFFVLIFTTVDVPAGQEWLKILYSLIMYIIYMIPRTFYYLPVFSLRQVATPDDGERLSLNAWISYGQAFGSSIPTLLIYPIIKLAAGSNESGLINGRRGYLVGAIVVAVTVVICSLFNYFTTKERVKSENKSTSLFKSIKVLMKDKNFVLNLVIFFLYGMCVTLTTGYAAYYCYYVAKNDSLITPISAMFIVGTILATPFTKKLYNKFGRNKTMVIGSAVLASGALIFACLAYFTVVAAFIYTFCVGVGTAITIIVIGISRADVADVIEWKEGTRMDGMVSNVQSLFKKLAHALIVFLIGLVLDACGFLESVNGVRVEQPTSAQIAIVIIMGGGCFLCAILMLLFSTKVTLDKEIANHNEILTRGKVEEKAK